jgi:hypothetical protein
MVTFFGVMQSRRTAPEETAAEDGNNELDQVTTHFAGIFGGLRHANSGAISGALIAALLADLNFVVAHLGNRASRRMAVAEKRALRDVPHATVGGGGSFLEDNPVNVEVT